MKKQLLSMIGLLAGFVITSSCVQEIKGGEELGKNEIAFKIGTVQTKAEKTPATVQGVTIPLGVSTEDGELTLVETIESLDFAPVTKGSPVYDENVLDVYGALFDAHDATTGGLPDAQFEYSEAKGYWSHNYDSDPWTKGSIAYWMNMPVAEDLSKAGVTNLAGDGATVTFSYKSKLTAADQKDILFTARTITKAQYDAGENYLRFFHALSGVKFAIGNQANSTKITSVEFSGLYDSGECTVTPQYVDGNRNGTTCTVEWSDKSKSGKTISQSFASVTSPVDYDSDDAYFGDSFYGAGHTQNINDETASLTFWFVPQQLTTNVVLKVNFTIDGVAHEQTIKFGDALKKDGAYPTWGAGELRTYTLDSYFVDVDVDDEVTTTNDTNDTKEGVVVTNTGNTTAYLRAAIVANWYDKNGKIVNVPWDTTDTYGEFINLPGKGTGTSGSWVLEDDGFYYYTLPVLPGEHTNTALFDKYIRVAKCPGYPSAKLEFTIAVQAVRADKVAAARESGWDPEEEQDPDADPETPNA